MNRASKKELAQAFREQGMRCNCDLDNWQPEETTGHSRVCRIHKAVYQVCRGDAPMPPLTQTAQDSDDG